MEILHEYILVYKREIIKIENLKNYWKIIRIFQKNQFIKTI